MKRAAIIGCGTIFQVHLPIIVANPEIELCAVCDNNPAVQEKLPAAAKAVPFYTDYEDVFHCRGDFLCDLQFFRVLCALSPAIIQLLLFGLFRLYGRICVAHHSSSCPISSVSCLAFPFQVFVFVLRLDRFCGCHPFSHHLPVSGDHLCTFGGTGLYFNDI